MINKLSEKTINAITDYVKFNAKQGYRFDEVSAELRRCYTALKKGNKPNYKGYDITESEILCICPNVQERMTLESLDIEKEQGRDALDLLISCAFLLGRNSGLKLGKKDGYQQGLREALELVKEKE